MAEYGIDGVFVQRFLGEVQKHLFVRDRVLENVRKGAETYGRVFVNMYDISSGEEATMYEDIINDWKHLVDDEKITQSDRYLHHDGRPLLAIWGFGFSDRMGEPEEVARLINWFKNNAEEKYRVTLMGGVPTKWRMLTGDSKSDPQWGDIYRSYDILSPWTVGRFRDNEGADRYLRDYVNPDKAECDKHNIDYLPVVFPGFSTNNLKPEKPFNEIPRKGGTFLWRQFSNVISSGNVQVYVAMFDEVDEGAAIFKLTENDEQTPTTGEFLTLDADEGFPNIPNDWYLTLVGAATGFLKNGGDFPSTIPSLQSTSKPILQPTTMPVALSPYRELTTRLDGRKPCIGNTFSVRAKDSPISIGGFKVRMSGTRRNSRTLITVFTKRGDPSNSNRWEFVHEIRVKRKRRPHLHDLGMFECPVIIASGKRQAFYIRTGNRYIYSTEVVNPSNVIKENGLFDVINGDGVINAQKKRASGKYVWNGTVVYRKGALGPAYCLDAQTA